MRRSKTSADRMNVDECMGIAKVVFDGRIQRDVQNFMEASKVHREAMIAGGFIQGIVIEAAHQLSGFPRSAVLRRMTLMRMPPSHLLVMFEAWTAMKDRFKEVTDLKIVLGEQGILLPSTEVDAWNSYRILLLTQSLFPKLRRLTLDMLPGARSLNWDISYLLSAELDLRLEIWTTPSASVMNTSCIRLHSLTQIRLPEVSIPPEKWIPLTKLPNLKHVTVGSLCCEGGGSLPPTATPEEWQRLWRPCRWETLVIEDLLLLPLATRLPLPVRLDDKPGSGVHLKGRLLADFTPIWGMADDNLDQNIERNCSVLAKCLNTVKLPLVITDVGKGKIRAMAPLFARKDIFEIEDTIQVEFNETLAGYNIKELLQVFPSVVEIAIHYCSIAEDVWSELRRLPNLGILDFKFSPDDTVCSVIRPLLELFTESLDRRARPSIVRLDREREWIPGTEPGEELYFENNWCLSEY